ncbi:MAG: YbjQ family protein [Gammaproteobacteria bacterium]|nr:YbjQ family protein [Gammaproteobacteria bacterium]
MSGLIIFLLLLTAGYFAGQSAEKSHYRSIRQRESELMTLPAVATKVIPDGEFADSKSLLVAGNVVISVDYFKRFVAGLRMLIGGQLNAYETLIDRARREALLRMKERARAEGADIVFNVKMETSSIYKGRGNTVGSVEVLAYGTALVSPSSKARGV